MAAGQLNNRIRFERQNIQPDDGFGNEATPWQEIATVAARIQPLRGREQQRGAAQESHVSHKIKVRQSTLLAGLDHSCRAVNVRTGAIFNIATVINPDERGRYLQIEAVKGEAS